MFTGLVQTVGRVAGVEAISAGRRIVVQTDSWGHRPGPGDSISVSGCCLTVTAADQGLLHFEAVPETLGLTTLGELAEGSRVNLEHAATPTTLLGGHIVQGHVDGLAVVSAVTGGDEYRLRLTPGAGLMQYVVPKGSVALDGVSLTVARVEPREGWFEVALIPMTLAETTLGELRKGDRVNLECDAMVKALVHWARHYGDGFSPGRPIEKP